MITKKRSSRKVNVIESSVNPAEKLLETVFPDFAEAVAEERTEAEVESVYPASLVETLFAYEPVVEDDNPKALRPYKPRILTPAEAEAKEAFEKARGILRTAKEKAKAEREKERAEKAANRSNNGTSPGRKGITRTESVAFALKANTALKTDLGKLAAEANRLFVEAGGDSNEKESRAVGRYAVAVLTAYGAF